MKKRTSRDHPNYSIIKIGQISEKSPGDLRRHTVIQTPVKDQHQAYLLLLSLLLFASSSNQR